MSSADIKAILLDVAQEFKRRDPQELLRFIGYASARVNRSAFGSQADLATAYLAAHMLKMSLRKGKSGKITSSKVGDVTTTYSTNATGAGATTSELDSTAYGQEYRLLRRSRVITPLVV